MRHFSKILSLALALMLALSVLVLPASALEFGIKAEVTATPVKVVDGNQVYQIDAYIDSTHSMYATNIWITWDDSAFQLMRGNGEDDARTVNARQVLNNDDPDAIFSEANTAYDEWAGYYEGDYLPQYGYALFPVEGTQPALATISDGSLGSELKEAGYTGISFTHMADSSDNYLLISGGSSSGKTSPYSGKVKVFSFYLREKAEAVPGTYEIGCNAKQVDRVNGAYTSMDEIASNEIDGNDMKSILSFTSDEVEYKNATVQVGEVGPAVTLSKQQINMDMDNDGVITDDFSFRALCEISNDDWNTYFANTAAAGSDNAINGVGIVAADKASFDLAAAQEAAKANFADPEAATGAYKVAWTTYIQKVGDASAYFGARIDTTKDSCQDVSYVGVVAYLDAEGAQQFMFFDAAKTVDLKTNYENYRAQYEAFLNQ